MKLLDLFSGTGSVASVARKLGYEVRTLDNDHTRQVDYPFDILRFDYKTELAHWTPDVVWASPPCTEYSTAKTRSPRNLPLANRIVKRTIEIIEWVGKRNRNLRWYIENPQTGLLKEQRFMRAIPYLDADYCCYGFPYRKRTRFWTNVMGPNAEPVLKLCPGAGVCKQMVGNRHKVSVGTCNPWKTDVNLNPKDKFPIPKPLLRKLLSLHP